MSVVLITYDLNNPGQQYNDLYDEIKQLGAWAHYLESVWFVETNESLASIRTKLKEKLDGNDSLFLSPVNDFDGWADEALWNWLRERI